MRRPARPVVALLGSLLITVGVLLVVELGLRLARVEPRQFRFAQRALDFDSMRVDPLLGPLPRPGYSGSWAGGFQVDVDAAGFRSSANGGAPAGIHRVVFMGDSCTFAWGIDTPETYVALLEARQRGLDPAPFELINAAFPGHTAVTGVYMLREIVLPLKPDIVVLGFGANNAFRLATISDAERLRSYELRRLVLHSRLLHILAAWLGDRQQQPFNPRDRDAVNALPLDQLRRVAAPDEFKAALRTVVTETRAAGAEAVFLIFPRASGVSRAHRSEDNASGARYMAMPDLTAPVDDRDLGMLEASCLDVGHAEASIAVIRERAQEWQPVYPDGPMVRAQINVGSDEYVRGEARRAVQTFNRAVGLLPRSPLAHYDRGVAAIAQGDTAAGLRDLDTAVGLSCNAFLHYQVLVWRLAVELDVPVVDLTLWFQTHDGENLFLDAAHPNADGQAIIAEALWPTLMQIAGRRPSAQP